MFGRLSPHYKISGSDIPSEKKSNLSKFKEWNYNTLQPNVFPAFGTIPRYLTQNSANICILYVSYFTTVTSAHKNYFANFIDKLEAVSMELFLLEDLNCNFPRSASGESSNLNSNTQKIFKILLKITQNFRDDVCSYS